jgi:protein TonB
MDVADLSLAAPAYGLRSFLADKVLVMAMTVSIGLHITALAVRFVDPELFRVRSTDAPVEIILVNAKSNTAPGTVEALAQNNLDGGGTNDAGRRTSPLPNSFEMRDGDSLESARKNVQQLEEEQKKLLATLRESLQLRPTPLNETSAQQPQSGTTDDEANEQLARAQPEIANHISD